MPSLWLLLGILYPPPGHPSPSTPPPAPGLPIPSAPPPAPPPVPLPQHPHTPSTPIPPLLHSCSSQRVSRAQSRAQGNPGHRAPPVPGGLRLLSGRFFLTG
ncbi:hypothetical protein VULLAG_LOCUS12354 [Vulpes lagopus]